MSLLNSLKDWTDFEVIFLKRTSHKYIVQVYGHEFLCILEDFKEKISKAKTVTLFLLVFLAITLNILVSVRGVTESGNDQYDFHCL